MRPRPTPEEVAEDLADGRYKVCDGCGDYIDATRTCTRAAKRRAEIEARGGKVEPTGWYVDTVGFDPDDYPVV
jgi:hypothetical protein